jgi:hypothetical protein
MSGIECRHSPGTDTLAAHSGQCQVVRNWFEDVKQRATGE